MKFAPYTSGRLKQLKVGITSYSEDKTPLEVVGSVSVGGSITVNESITANNIAITSTTSTSEFANLNVTGVSTFSNSVGINSNLLVTGISTLGITSVTDLKSQQLNVSGISTFNGVANFNNQINALGDVNIGDATSDILSVVSRIDTSLVPTASGTRNLGQGDRPWNLYGDNIFVSGISTFTNDIKANDSLTVLGNVGVGTTDPNAVVDSNNTSRLAVGILTAHQIYSTLYGQFTGGSVLAENIVGAALSISGISTLGGNVAIGTDNVNDPVGASNTAILAVGILTANRIYSTVYGEFTGGSVVADNIVGSALSVSGISTMGIVQISSGIITATSGVVTYFGDGSNLTGTGDTTNIRTNTLGVVGVSTFDGLIDANGRIVGAATSNVIPFLYNDYSDLPSAGSYHGAFAHVHSVGKAFFAHAGNWFEIVSKESDGVVGTGTERYNIGPILSHDSLYISGITTLGGDVRFNGNIISDITGDGNTNITGINSVTATNFFGNISGVGATFTNITGTLQTASQTNITSVGTLGALTVSGNINANGNIVGDNATNISGINSVTATSFFGDGQKIEPRKIYPTTSALNIDYKIPFVQSNDSYQIPYVDASGFTYNPSTNVLTAGIVTATSFIGDGSQLTNISADSVGTLASLNVTGLSTFGGDARFNGNIIGDNATNISGINSVTVTSYYGDGSDLVGVAKSTVLEDAGINTSGTSTFTNVKVIGISTLGSNVIVGGATTDLLVKGDVRITDNLKVGSDTINIDGNSNSITVSNLTVSGVATFSNDIKANGNITGDGATNITGINGVTASTLSGTLQTAAQPNITSVGTLGSINVTGISTFGDDINVGSGATVIIDDKLRIYTGTGSNGHAYIEEKGDGTLFISSNQVSITDTNYASVGLRVNPNNHTEVYYSGSEKIRTTAHGILVSGITSSTQINVSGGSTFGGNIDANGDLDVDGHTSLDDVFVTGLATFSNTVKFGAILDADAGADILGHTELDNVNVSGVSTFVGDITVGGNITGDGSTVISGVTSVIATKFFGNGEGITGITADSLGDLDHIKVTGLSTFVGNAQFDGNVSIAGTLTYDDVTNVDSIGVVTARSGIIVGAGISAVGVVTASGFVGGGANLTSLNASQLSSGTVPDGRFPATLPTISGENLTNVNAVFATKAGIATYTSSWAVTANGSSAYRFSGPGNLSTQDDPTIYLVRGQQYEFDLNVSGHPFLIRVSSGGSQYTDGVTTVGNNQTGKIRFDVPMDAPSELFYQCQYHSGMLGRFAIGDTDKIFEGNSKVEVVDSGSGYILAETDGAERLRITSGGQVNIGGNYTNTSGVFQVTGHSELDDVDATHVNVSGVSTFAGSSNFTGCLVSYSGILATANINANGNIIGDNATNISGINSVTATCFFGCGAGLTGIDAGFSQDSQGNLYAGTNAGANSDADTCFNIALGCNAGCCLNSGDHNVLLGCRTGQHLTSGGCNVFIGPYSASWSSSANCNVAIGYKTAASSSFFSGNDNVMLGNQSGLGIESGKCNVFIGRYTGYYAKATCNNVYLGATAGYWFCTNAHSNIAIGHAAASARTTGCDNIAIGCQALQGDVSTPTNATGSNNIAIGKQTGLCVTSGCYNIFFGINSGNDATTANKNIAIGNRAARCMETGSNNVAIGGYSGGAFGAGVSGASANVSIGLCALQQLIYGDYNVAIGPQAGAGGGPGDRNVAIGLHAGYCGVKSSDTIAIGYAAGCRAADPVNGCGIFIGRYAGRLAEEGKAIMIGCEAGKCAVDADNSIFIGSAAGKCACNASDGNLFIGINAGRGSSTLADNTGNYNIAFGKNALINYTSASDNVVIGCNAGCTITSGSCNVLIGYGATVPSATGNTQLAIGSGNNNWIAGDNSYNVTLSGIATVTASTGVVEATKFCGDGSCLTNLPTGGFDADDDANLFADNTCSGCNLDGTNGCHNILFGSCAGKEVTQGACNIFLGFDAGRCNQTGSSNVYIGQHTGKTVCCGSFDVSMGFQTLCESKYACNNVAIGKKVFPKLNCGGQNDYGMFNIGIGGFVGTALTTGRYNLIMGYNNALCMTTGCTNIILGCRTAKTMTGGTDNIFIGKYAGKSDVVGSAGDNNIAIGNLAGLGVSATSDRNVFLGYGAGRYASGGCFNVAIGDHSGSYVTGNRNVFLGQYAGSTQCVTGNQNVVIGDIVCLPSASGTKQLVIGAGSTNWIVGNCGFDVGIGTTNPKTDFQVGAHYGVVGGGGTFTAAAGVAHTINEYTIASTDFKTAEYTIFTGIGTNIQSQKLLVMQDGTTAYSEQYAVMSNNTLLVSVGANIASGVVKIELTPESGISGLTTFRFTRHTTL